MDSSRTANSGLGPASKLPVIEIRFETREPATCENGHYLCGKCVVQSNDRCMLCEGRIFDNDGNTWVRLQTGESCSWTPEMIREWTMQNEFNYNLSSSSVRGDLCALSEDYDTASMNLLYSKGKAYEVESPNCSGSVNISDSKWNNSARWNQVCHPKQENCFSKSGHNITTSRIPRRSSKLCSIEDKSVLDRKDTRQELLDQTKEEIRAKIMEEIFTSFKNDPRQYERHDECTHIKQLHTIGVSTESTPKLFSEDNLTPETIERPQESKVKGTIIEQSDFNQAPKEFLAMNVETSNTPLIEEDLEKKNSSSCMNLRLHQVMGTLLESNQDTMIEDQIFYRLLHEKFAHMPLKKLKELMSTIYDERNCSNTAQACPPYRGDLEPKPSIDLSLMSNSRRAFYNPPNCYQSEIMPSAQFQPISFYSVNASSDLQQAEAMDAATLNIPRSPVICPISTCQRAFFVSDFTKHIAVDHPKVPSERLCPRQCKNFFLDPKLIHFGTSRCQVLLLVRDKIKNLGHEKFKDFIPVLVMTTKVNLLELCCNQYRVNSEKVQNGVENFIMIWLTGLMPPQLPIFFSLTVWARSGSIPTCHIVHSGRLYSVRNPQSPEAIRRSGQMMLLSEKQVNLLTNKGRNMLEMQVAVH